MVERQIDALAHIRAKIAAGVLPADAPGTVYARPGSGALCDACDRPIDQEDVEYDVDVAGERMVYVHRACFHLWRTAYARDRGRPWPSPATRRARIAARVHAGELPSPAPGTRAGSGDVIAYAKCAACEDVLDRWRMACVVPGDADTPTAILCVQCFTAWLEVLRASEPAPASARG